LKKGTANARRRRGGATIKAPGRATRQHLYGAFHAGHVHNVLTVVMIASPFPMISLPGEAVTYQGACLHKPERLADSSKPGSTEIAAFSAQGTDMPSPALE